MDRWLIFLAGTTALAWISRHALSRPRSHGFYRFFAWECILALILVNAPMWEVDPFVPRQIVSWLLLFSSPFMALHAVVLLRRVGHPTAQREERDLFTFEKTSSLVTRGIYRYVRHPMYAALLFLAWGAFLKDISWVSLALVTVATVMLLLTAIRDEQECCEYFGSQYAEYMTTTKRFVPFVF